MSDVLEQLADVRGQTDALPAQQTGLWRRATRSRRSATFTPAEKPRPVYLLARGDVRSPKELMAAGRRGGGARARRPILRLPNPDDEGQRRVAAGPLAGAIRRTCWFADRSSIGSGIIISGRESSTRPTILAGWVREPSHPELLDWLAGWFFDQWRVAQSACTG